MSNFHKDIIDFLFNNRTKYLFPDWTWEQIASYMLSYFTFNQVRITREFNNGLITGVLVFEEINGETLHIIHWATDKTNETFIKFLIMLDTEYPYIKYLLSTRKFNKQVLYPVDKLNNKYLQHLIN